MIPKTFNQYDSRVIDFTFFCSQMNYLSELSRPGDAYIPTIRTVSKATTTTVRKSYSGDVLDFAALTQKLL